MVEKNTTLAVVAPTAPRVGLMRPVVRPAEIIEAHKEAAEVIREALEDGRDYGLIPGAGSRKVLLKAGAERLCVAFGLRPVYSVVLSEADHDREVQDKYGKKALGLYRFIMKCELVKDGVLVGEGIGSCSTMESKYISRPRDCENTALKMGKKRALVDAVLSTLSLSDRFTQDVGDDERDDEGKGEAPKKPSTAQQKQVDDATAAATAAKRHADMRAAVSAEYDRLGVGVGLDEKARSSARIADMKVILGGRKPDSLQDLDVVLGTLKGIGSMPAREPDDIQAAQ